MLPCLTDFSIILTSTVQEPTMKIAIITLALCFLFMEMFALPVENYLEGENDHEVGHVRAKRATCDLLSFEAKGVKINDAACAAHCLFLGKRGGYCSNKRVCICRN